MILPLPSILIFSTDVSHSRKQVKTVRSSLLTGMNLSPSTRGVVKSLNCNRNLPFFFNDLPTFLNKRSTSCREARWVNESPMQITKSTGSLTISQIMSISPVLTKKYLRLPRCLNFVLTLPPSSRKVKMAMNLSLELSIPVMPVE